MTSRPLLSICIPTYNREAYLRECLASLQLDGVRDRVEVVVSDNASTDQTLRVLEGFRDVLPIRWIVQENNLGADRNFDAVIAEARGEYCWLLGSDDAVMPGAIPRLIDLLRLHSTDILQFGYVQTDVSLHPLRRVYPDADLVESTPAGLAQHLGRLPTLSLLFTFISAYVFRRTVWMERRQRVLGWVGSHYIQTAAMHAALVDGATLAAVKDCLVMARGDNPNEFNTIPGRFIALDARTMTRLMIEIHGNASCMWVAIGQTFRRSYPPRALIYTAANGGLNYLTEVTALLYQLGYPRTLLTSLRLAGQLKLLGVVKIALDVRRAIVAKLIPKV